MAKVIRAVNTIVRTRQDHSLAGDGAGDTPASQALSRWLPSVACALADNQIVHGS
jgi:hypothetical protein